MDKVNKKQIVKVISGDDAFIYPIDDIYAVSHLDNFHLVVNHEDDFLDILTGSRFVSDNKKLVVEPFRSYILNNIGLFDKDLVDVALDDTCQKEVSFDRDLFIKCFDKLKNKVYDYSDRILEVLDDGTVIEQYVNFCDKNSLLDKLMSLNGVSEESIIMLLCDESNCEVIKTNIKGTDGKVFTSSFVIRKDDHILINDIIQLYYCFNEEGFINKKPITCQSERYKYDMYDFEESYSNELKISLEKVDYYKKIFK